MANARPRWMPSAPILAAALLLFAASVAFALDPDPVTIRILANNFGLGSLKGVVLPESPQISTFIQDRTAAIRLGKALFWDMQVGSDGQACGSCHFHAGADSRAKNQLQPGTNGGDVVSGNNPFNGFIDFPGFGPNYTLTAGDFPFHLLTDAANTNSAVLRDTNDAVSSQGVFKANFLGIDPLSMFDSGAPVPDPIFHVNGINTRRVEPRNTPTIFNAAHNIINFWDGRANFYFNGVNPFGPLDRASGIQENVGGALTPKIVRIPLASLASQAVGPPLSENEMSFIGRTFPDIGRKLIPRQPLAYQRVHPQDSVLGPLSRATLNPDGTAGGLTGLNTTYDNLVRTAFFPQYWDSADPVNGYTQMEANFSLFFGLAVQLYESTLVSDQTPFDRFMDGDDRALTSRQLLGLEAFVGKGGCAACHRGPLFSDASLQVVGFGPPTAPVVPNEIVELMAMNDAMVSLYDGPFHNIGVRPSSPVGAFPPEDMGRGGTAPFANPRTGLEYPLSFSHLAELKDLGLLPADVAALTPTLDPRLPSDLRVAADGEFKTPSLRNADLTGPYFHNGGQSLLKQVVQFYDRGGDFLAFNDPNSDPLAPFIGFTPAEEDALVAFLLGLTDPRVRLEKAPFDHPQILVPDGHPGDRNGITCIDPRAPLQACDLLTDVPAVGASGRLAVAGLGPLSPFLGLEQLPLDVGLSESLPSPQPVGTPAVAFTAIPVGGSGSYEFRFLLDNVIMQPYSAVPAWTWNTSTAAQDGYVVAVQARNAGSAAPFDASYEMPYVIGKPPATGVTLAASPASPQAGGALVRFDAAASGPSGSFEYRFLLTPPGGAASVMRTYSPIAFWAWDSTGSPDGTYTIAVQARTTGSTAAFETSAALPYLLSSGPSAVSLAASPTGPQPAGTAVTFTAAASGGTGPYEYRFLGRAAGSTVWSVAQAYGPASSWAWNGVPGNWEVMVNARSAGAPAAAEATQTIAYTVSAPPLPPAAGVTVTASPVGPQTAGTAVTFTGSATGGTSSYEYQFLGRAAGSAAWSVAQAYGPASSWTWTGVAGNWEIQVNARSAGSAAAVEAAQTIAYAVSAPPATGVTVTASPAGPQTAGTAITFTGTAGGGTGSYEYRFLGRAVGAPTFSVAQEYGPSDSWTWTGVAGSWEIQVQARSVGSIAPFDASATIADIVN